MRIALIHMRHAHTGGVERYLNLLSAHLAEAGHQSVVVCRSHVEPSHPAIEFVKLRPTSIGATARMLNFAKAVEQHVRESRYDLVYNLGRSWSHDVIRLGGGCHATYLELAHEATRTPFEKLVGKGQKKNRVTLEIEARALAPGNYRQVITNSEMTKRDAMARYEIPEELVRVIHNGADVEHFHPRLRAEAGMALRHSIGWTDEHEVLLFLGTGYGRKGLDRVMNATAKLALERPAMRLLVVGFDSARPTFEARAKSLGIAERTVFLGGRKDAEVCYAASDVYAIPTRYDPFANSTIEALASGLPTITTLTNGGHELIEEGVDGSVLSRDYEDDELAQRVAHWFDHREEGSMAARRKAEHHQATYKMQETRELLEQLAKA